MTLKPAGPEVMLRLGLADADAGVDRSRRPALTVSHRRTMDVPRCGRRPGNAVGTEHSVWAEHRGEFGGNRPL